MQIESDSALIIELPPVKRKALLEVLKEVQTLDRQLEILNERRDQLKARAGVIAASLHLRQVKFEDKTTLYHQKDSIPKILDKPKLLRFITPEQLESCYVDSKVRPGGWRFKKPSDKKKNGINSSDYDNLLHEGE